MNIQKSQAERDASYQDIAHMPEHQVGREDSPDRQIPFEISEWKAIIINAPARVMRSIRRTSSSRSEA
jgi:hypothetical protein